MPFASILLGTRESCSSFTPCTCKFSGDPLARPVPEWTPRRKIPITKRNGRYVCNVCEKSYSSHSSCYSHYASHIGKTTCEICNMVMSHRGALVNHMAKHLGTIWCEKCNATFATKFLLRRHQLTSKCSKKFAFRK
jgi:protein-arginine kinase activator protein McsA